MAAGRTLVRDQRVAAAGPLSPLKVREAAALSPLTASAATAILRVRGSRTCQPQGQHKAKASTSDNIHRHACTHAFMHTRAHDSNKKANGSHTISDHLCKFDVVSEPHDQKSSRFWTTRSNLRSFLNHLSEFDAFFEPLVRKSSRFWITGSKLMTFLNQQFKNSLCY